MFFCCLPALASNDIPDDIQLTVGESRVLAIQLRRVALGNGEVVSLSTPESGQLLLIGEAAGETTAQLWLRDGRRKSLRIVVLEQDLSRRLAEVRALLNGVDAVSARIVSQRILLEGAMASAVDRQRAASVAALYPGLVLDFVGKVGWEAMIQFDARLIEVRRDQLHQLGLRWDSTSEGPAVGLGIGEGADSALVGWRTLLGSRLDLLHQKGMAQTIAEPSLSCRSGGVARFVSGGEIPLPVTNDLGATDVQYKEYGIILEVRPHAAATGEISAEVDIELSQVDASVRVGDFPGFIKRRSSTAINVRAGETIVIAGLLARESSLDRHGIPGLGRIPGAGRLFSSRHRHQRETELLVLLTPRRIRISEAETAARTTDQESLRQRLESAPAIEVCQAMILTEEEIASIHEELIQRLDLRRNDIDRMPDQELRRLAQRHLRDVMSSRQATELQAPGSVEQQILQEVVGLGAIEELLADERVTEIMVNGPGVVFVECAGRLTRSQVRFSSARALAGVIERLLQRTGRRVDEASPMVDARLPEGSRVNVVIPPLALDGASITIRKFTNSVLGLEDLIAVGALSAPMAELLRKAVLERQNIVVSGGTGTGKTTLLNCLSTLIPDGERIVTIEDSAELRLRHPNLVRLEARPSNAEGRGLVTIRELVRNALRMRPDRIVIGECRGGEALDMLQAMNTGHDGSLTTAHANSPQGSSVAPRGHGDDGGNGAAAAGRPRTDRLGSEYRRAAGAILERGSTNHADIRSDGYRGWADPDAGHLPVRRPSTRRVSVDGERAGLFRSIGRRGSQQSDRSARDRQELCRLRSTFMNLLAMVLASVCGAIAAAFLGARRYPGCKGIYGLPAAPR